MKLSTNIITRFAPSPTGYLHIGGARTALFAYLFARHYQGQFLLRIENTDLQRSTDESSQAIFAAMEWLGLTWDAELLFQSQRFTRYREVAQQLLAQGKAYRCCCTKERLDALREQQLLINSKPRYDGHCRNLSIIDDTPYVIRFKNPQQGSVSWQDLVYGTIDIQNSELDDLIILRTDGTPTYNFTVVVDDWDMHMTHVLRGEDHINNTPRQLNIFYALGAKPPQYAHLPMLLGNDGQRLSKRHGAVGVMNYRDEGFLPEAVLNYLVRLGWSHGDQEVFSLAEMIELFDVNHINKSPAIFNLEKLAWLNQHYLKTLPPHYIAKQLAFQFERLNIDTNHGPDLIEVVKLQAKRVKNLKEMAKQSIYFYTDNWQYNRIAVDNYFSVDLAAVLNLVADKLQALDLWEQVSIHAALTQVITETGLKFNKIGSTLRIAITGNTSSPPLDITLELIGQQRCVQRLHNALDYFYS